MGSDSQHKKKREEPSRKERNRDFDDYKPNTGGKYDPHTGSNNLFKKLGIQEKREEPEKKDDDIEFPEEPTPPQQEQKPATTFTAPPAQVQKAAPKFLPPPPSKAGGVAPQPTVAATSTAKQPASGSP